MTDDMDRIVERLRGFLSEWRLMYPDEDAVATVIPHG